MSANDGRYVDQLVGARIRRAMRAAGWDQEALAARLGVTQATVSRKVSGVRAWSPAELLIVADALGTTVGALFGEASGGADSPDEDLRAAGRRAVTERLRRRAG